jgi:hypothetical protein
MSITLEPNEIVQTFARLLGENVSCVRQGEELRLDTPYVLQDGCLLQVFLSAVPGNGHIVASDGAYAVQQIEILSSPATLRARYGELERIARELDLDWDTEFKFVESDMESVLRRIAVLARAVDRSLGVVTQRTRRSSRHIGAQISSELRDLGLHVTRRAKLVTAGDQPPVTVDLRVRGDDAEAAVEVITAQTEGWAASSIDRAAATFRVLERGRYAGHLVAVYDPYSPVAKPENLRRFKAAGPDDAKLVPSDDAVDEIERLLVA